MRAGVVAVMGGVLVLAGCGGGGSSTPSGPAPVLPPTANAGGPYTGQVGTPVSFNGAASSDPQGQALTYAWNFGDGSTGTGVTATHTYQQVAGVSSMTYTVSLTVQDTYGETGQTTTKATIQGAAPLPDAGLTGNVSTGTSAIVGAHVYLFAANTTGNAGAGIAASSSNASVSLLSATETAASDAVGAYVGTDANGNFTMSGEYTCTSGQQLYLYVSGGTAGGLTNTAGTLMAAIGSCPATSSTVVAKVNEVSTVATAYGLEGFATDPLHVSSSGSALALVGIANAFANAANLETLATGVALATTPAGNGTAPQATVNSLANLLSVCVNPANYSATSCTTLFAAALSAGLTGTAPKDTATAALYVAQNPGANPSDIYNVPMSSPPYAPGLGRTPNDWTVSIVYTGGGLSNPLGIAIDSAGNAWMANSIATGTVTELSSTGAVKSGTSGYAATGLSLPMGIAVDPSGNVWTANSTGGSITEFSPTGSVLSGSYSGGGLQNAVGVAIDGSGNVWVENAGNASVAKITNAGALVSTYNTFAPDGDDSIAIDGSGNVWLAANGNFVAKLSNTGTTLSGGGYTNSGLNGLTIAGPAGIAIDSAGNAWVVNGAGNSVTELSNAGSAITGPGGLTSASLATPFAIAIDGAGSAFVLNRPKFNTGVAVVEISSAGAFVSGTSGFVGGNMNSPFGIAIDGSGDVWITNSASNAVMEFIGVAAPVVTPLSAGVKNNTLAKRP